MEDRDWLPEKEKEQIRRDVYSNEKYIQVKKKIEKMKRQGYVMQAMMVENDLKKKMEALIIRQQNEAGKQIVDLGKIVAQMNEEDSAIMNESIHAITILSDMLEYFSSEMIQAVERTKPGFYMPILENIRKMGKDAGKLRMFVEKRSENIFAEVMAGEMDKITEMIHNKAKSIIKKTETARKKSNKLNGKEKK